MKFVDEIKINVQGGKGGNGVIRFNPEFGPSGGTGGNGGNVILHATHNCNTLSHLAQYAIIKGKDGKTGSGADAAQGKSGKDAIIEVPIGTIVKNYETNEILLDLKKEGKYVIARGGLGGRGNASFVTNQNKAPRIYEYGMPGEQFKLFLEVQVLADCGIIGFPSSGKSSFISIVSKAKPQIAAYPFTTLSPVVGVVHHKNFRFIMADLPGLIEGASEGKGLGVKFLKHASRCKVLVHFIAAESNDYLGNYKTIRNELKKFSLDLFNKQEIICISKSDLGVNKQELTKIKRTGKVILEISSHSKQNVNLLLDKIIELLSKMKTEEMTKIDDDVEVIDLLDLKGSKLIQVELNDGKFMVTGSGAETLVLRCPLDTEDNIMRFSYILSSKKVFHKLKKLGWTMDDEIHFPFNVVLMYVDGLLQLKPI